MTPRSIATASHGDVAQAAASVFPNGNAVDAVVAGVFAAAAVFPSTLMGPVQILVGGAGAGLRAVDGRNRQPGLGIPRPRGFKDGEVIPPAARVAVPCLPGALAALLATAGSMTLSRVMGPALDLAGAVPERKKFLKRLSQQGPSLLADDAIAGELTHGAGRMGGGLLTQEDLEGALPAILSCTPTKRFGLPVVTAPWATSVLSDGPHAREGDLDTSAVHAVVAADTFGVVAVACFEARSGGVHFAEFGIEAPPFAEPVLRGERRTPPGDTRPAGCPIALVATTEAGVDVALAMTHAGLGESHLSQLLHRMGKAPSVEAAIRAPRAAHEGDGDEASPFASNVGHALGVHRSRTFARILSDPRR